jgi:hypothetical protein
MDWRGSSARLTFSILPSLDPTSLLIAQDMKSLSDYNDACRSDGVIDC